MPPGVLRKHGRWWRRRIRRSRRRRPGSPPAPRRRTTPASPPTNLLTLTASWFLQGAAAGRAMRALPGRLPGDARTIVSTEVRARRWAGRGPTGRAQAAARGAWRGLPSPGRSGAGPRRASGRPPVRGSPRRSRRRGRERDDRPQAPGRRAAAHDARAGGAATAARVAAPGQNCTLTPPATATGMKPAGTSTRSSKSGTTAARMRRARGLEACWITRGSLAQPHAGRCRRRTNRPARPAAAPGSAPPGRPRGSRARRRARLPSVVTHCVCGMMFTPKLASVTSFTVRLTPSTATEPLGAM